MELFENILNEILNESVGEAIVNPNDNTKDVFNIKSTPKGDKTIIIANLDKDDVKKITEIDNTLIVKQWAGTVVANNELDDPNSPAYQNIIRLCNAVSKLGKYGQINPNEVIDEVKFTANQAITPEKRQEVEADEDALWNEFVNKFDDPRIQQLLQSFHTYLPLESLDHKFSQLNITKILSQDAKRIAAGKQPATFVASPQDWRNKYNRRIKNNAIPFYLYYPKYKDDVADQFYDAHATKVFGDEKDKILGGKSAKQYAKDLSKGGSKTFGQYRNFKFGARQAAGTEDKFYYAPFYDIADTESINGLEDKWNDPERLGVVDNIRWKPTEASMGKLGDNLGMSKDELNQAMGGIDDDYAIKAYNALKVLCRTVQNSDDLGDEVKMICKNSPQTNPDGSVNMDEIKKDVFTLTTAYVAKMLTDMYANPTIRLTKARMVACMFVGSHRIAPEQAIEIFRGLNKDEINAEAEKLDFQYKTIYRKLVQSINNIISVQTSVNQPKQRKVMEENVNMNNLVGDFYTSIDNVLNILGLDKDGNDKVDVTQEEFQLNEAKFYAILNKLNNPNFN